MSTPTVTPEWTVEGATQGAHPPQRIGINVAASCQDTDCSGS